MEEVYSMHWLRDKALKKKKANVYVKLSPDVTGNSLPCSLKATSKSIPAGFIGSTIS